MHEKDASLVLPYRRELLARAIGVLLEFRHRLDPTLSVPVYDLHKADGHPTGYCLVRADWLDMIWSHVPQSQRGPMMPHEHLDPESDP